MPIFGPGRISKGIRQDMAILLKRPEHTWHIELEDYLLYVDAGCWQGNDKGDFKSNFVLISGNGVAVCNYYPVKRSHVSVRHLHKLKNWETEFNKCKVILDFLKLIDSSNPLSHLLYFCSSCMYFLALMLG